MASPVDTYVAQSTLWPAELRAARAVLRKCGLTEELKWRKPCYSHDGRNIVILQEMKGFLALMFFEGARLRDPDGLLESQGPNSQSALRLCVRSVADVRALTPAIQAFVAEAVALPRSGPSAVKAPKAEWSPVDALQERLDADPKFRAAFTTLTPGRQREYHLHISTAKQLDTRRARVEKLAPQILAGKGLRDR
ncbi:MAG: hypothetical protein RL238_257 [Actinomycetota bacterium]|jgi:uncharacterized protein YdeI (YjbR/CyaY-like superfamily)